MRNRKMLKLISAAIISLWVSICFAGRSPTTYFQARNDLQKISSRDLMKTLTDFVSASAPARMVGMAGHEKAKNHLLEAIKNFDPKATGKTSLITVEGDIDEAKNFYQKDFDTKVEGKIPKNNPDYQKWNKFTQYMKDIAEKLRGTKLDNIVWEKTGTNPKKVLVVVAHYDTMNQDPNTLYIKALEPMPGANYNGTGVSVGLGLIKTLSQFDFHYTIQVVFLDWQSIGYLGGFQYAKELKRLQGEGKEIMGVIDLEMLGQDTTFLDKTKKSGNLCVYTRPDSQEEKWVKGLLQHGSKITTKVTFEHKANGFDMSDTFRFWDQGFLGATFTQNWEDDFNPKFYQSSLDTADTINATTLHNAYQFIGGAVIGTLMDISK